MAVINPEIQSTGIQLTNLSITYPLLRYEQRKTWKGAELRKTGGRIIRPRRGVTRICALDRINLDLKPGERLGVIGHNGAGKSTLLQAMVGIYPPTEGCIRVQGRIASMLDINTGFDLVSSGIDNIRLRALFMNIPKRVLETRIDEVAAFTELGDYLNLPLGTYSSGMKARLAFAIATGFDPEIVIMDEWLSAGDRSFREKAEARMKTFVDQADILVIATHSDHLLRKVCNRAIVLDTGHVIFDGPVEEAIELRSTA